MRKKGAHQRRKTINQMRQRAFDALKEARETGSAWVTLRHAGKIWRARILSCENIDDASDYVVVVNGRIRVAQHHKDKIATVGPRRTVAGYPLYPIAEMHETHSNNAH